MLSKLIRDKSNISFTNFQKFPENENGGTNYAANTNLPQFSNFNNRLGEHLGSELTKH